MFSVCIAMSTAIPSIFMLTYGATFYRDRAFLKRLLPLILVALLPVTFMVVFCFYRAAFMQMTAAEQAIFAPVWPC